MPISVNGQQCWRSELHFLLTPLDDVLAEAYQSITLVQTSPEPRWRIRTADTTNDVSSTAWARGLLNPPSELFVAISSISHEALGGKGREGVVGGRVVGRRIVRLAHMHYGTYDTRGDAGWK